MRSLVVRDFIFKEQVLLLDESINNSMSRCVALACSTEYHMTGSYYNTDDPLALATMYDKTLLVYDKQLSLVTSYNQEGAGCIILFKNGSNYKLASILDDEGQHITCFSKFHPLVLSITKQ